MQQKTGFGILAAAGVAVGVIGMTMGGASGASTTCRPTPSASVNAGRSSGADHSAANSSAANTSAADATNPTGADGTTGGAADTTNPGTTIVAGATVPDPGAVPVDGSSTSSSDGDRPLLHLRENTNPTDAAGVAVPHTGTSVVGRSSNVSGLHVFGLVDQGR